MSAEIHEPITAAVVFDRAHVRPTWFLWKQRRYPIKEVTQWWRTKEGQAIILHLGVTDGSTCFELTFNQHTLVWHLASIAPEHGT